MMIPIIVGVLLGLLLGWGISGQQEPFRVMMYIFGVAGLILGWSSSPNPQVRYLLIGAMLGILPFTLFYLASNLWFYIA
jgi:hypothetical protein